MSRYFFHILGRVRWEDEEGQEFPDLPAAWQCAIARLGTVDCRRLGSRRAELSIQVTSEDGATLFAVSLAQPLSASGRSGRYWLH